MREQGRWGSEWSPKGKTRETWVGQTRFQMVEEDENETNQRFVSAFGHSQIINPWIARERFDIDARVRTKLQGQQLWMANKASMLPGGPIDFLRPLLLKLCAVLNNHFDEHPFGSLDPVGNPKKPGTRNMAHRCGGAVREEVDGAVDRCTGKASTEATRHHVHVQVRQLVSENNLQRETFNEWVCKLR